MPAANSNVKLVFSAICGAISLVVMALAGVIPIASIALPAIAGCILIPVIIECSEKYAYGVYLLVAILSFFITADREAMFIYVLFFGYYPVLYSTLSRIKSKVLAYVIKIIIFNTAAVADYFIVTFVLGIPIESIEILGDFTLIVLLLAANVVFVLYDGALKGLGYIYYSRLHPAAKKFLFKK